MTVQTLVMLATRTGRPATSSRSVELLGALVLHGVEAGVHRLGLGRVQVVQEGRHRGHHVGVGVEGAAGEADVGRVGVVEAAHQLAAAADHAHRQAAAQGLAVGDHVGLHAEVFLRAAAAQAEAHEDLVEDQHDAALGADLAQLLQPGGGGGAVEVGAARAVHQGRVARRGLVGVQGLQRVDQHAGDVVAGAQHLQAALVLVAQGVGLARGQGLPGPGCTSSHQPWYAPQKRTRWRFLVW
jgi:hypothetical protein